MEVTQELPDSSTIFDIRDILDNIKDLLEEIYPGCWDIQENQEEDIYNIFIHFPEIVVRNYETNDSHTIYDMYVKIVLNRSDFTIASKLEGCRATRTYKEYISGYNHSHLNAAYSSYNHNFSKFCLGESDLAEKHIDLRGEFNLTKFEAYLYLLKPYLETESSEGGPYMYISSIVLTKQLEEPTINDKVTFYNEFIMSEIPFKVNIDKLNYQVYYNLVLSDEFIHSLLYITPARFKIKISEDGKQEPLLTSNDGTTNLFINTYNTIKYSFDSVLFRGLPVYRKLLNDIVPEEVTEDTINYKVIPHPDLTDYLTNTINKELKEKAINYYNGITPVNPTTYDIDNLPF